MKRDVYLSSVSLEKAQEIIDAVFTQSKYKTSYEILPVKDALNRVLFESVYARLSSPLFNASAMDGIATSSKLIEDASETNPVTIKSGNFIEVNTGNVIPSLFDTVVMIEDINYQDDGSIIVIKSHALFQNIRPIGEDIAKGDMIASKNMIITPVIIAALLSGGINTVKVIKKPSYAIIPTGDEIVSDSTNITSGQIIDSNSYYLQTELQNDGIDSIIFPVVKDEYDALEKTILKVSNNFDCILIGAGSSAGSKDFASDVVKNNGTIFVHGISIKPGKPTIIGMINDTIIIGVPGYPVSTYMAYLFIVKRLNRLMLNQPTLSYRSVSAKLTKKLYSSLKNEEYIRVKLGNVDNEVVATPLNRGAGITMSLVKSDGLLKIDRLREGYEVGAQVEVILPTETTMDISNTLVSIGSHDIALDILNDLMCGSHFNLASSHLGSFSGVLAMKNKEAHIAPVHILHKSGEYNTDIIKQYLNDDYLLVEGILRTQSIYVKKGNPKRIKTIQDLTRSDVTYVNRQKGSGTRILLDYLLQKEEINPKDIKGYAFELPTHTAVAASVSDERYDAGLGVVSVANLYDLDFVDIGLEQYDFLIHKDTLKLKSYKTFIKQLNSKEFRQKLNDLGGYIINQPGTIKT